MHEWILKLLNFLPAWGIVFFLGIFMPRLVREDILFGVNIGALPVLVLTGSGRESLERLREIGLQPAHVATNVLRAADWILHMEGRKSHDPL